jgi:hypothetical protein
MINNLMIFFIIQILGIWTNTNPLSLAQQNFTITKSTKLSEIIVTLSPTGIYTFVVNGTKAIGNDNGVIITYDPIKNTLLIGSDVYTKSS